MIKKTMEDLNRISASAFRQSQKQKVIIVLDNIRSLSNIGSFFRTADAFAIEAIYLCGITATPPHREIHKTALGATDSVAWEYFQDTLDAISSLRDKGYTIAALEQTHNSISLLDYQHATPTAYIFGNEVDGVSEKMLEVCDLILEIPQAGTKHSLNVAVCAGILLWHITLITNK